MNKRKTCPYKMINGEPCGRELYDEEHCIFHSRGIENKKKIFNKEFRVEFKRQLKNEKNFDFKGFVFPDQYSFEKHEFKKRVYFIKAEFHESVVFHEIKFPELVDFSDAKFYKETKFNGVEFQGRARFVNSRFNGDANFSLTKFSKFADFGGETKFFGNACFTGAKFFGYANFGLAQFHRETTFREAKFFENADFQSIVLKNFDNFLMENTYFYNVRGLFEFIKKNKKKFAYSKARFLKFFKFKITEFLPKYIKLILGEEASARYPVVSRKIKDDLYLLDFRRNHPCWFFLWKLSANCGRSFRWWFVFCVILVFIFSIIFYCLLRPNSFEIRYLSDTSFFTMLYYSTVTFTTLGFGDVVPKTTCASILVMAEVILGYIMLGGKCRGQIFIIDKLLSHSINKRGDRFC